MGLVMPEKQMTFLRTENVFFIRANSYYWISDALFNLFSQGGNPIIMSEET